MVPAWANTTRTATANKFPATNGVFIIVGVLILFFGWFGFNGGSTLNGNDLRMSVIVMNTMLAGATGATTVMYVRLIRTGMADGVAAGNGALAGLVAITAPCAFVAPWAAVVIGLIAGLVMLWGEGFVEKTLKVDDPVGAITVHGILGFVGLLMVGIFADGTYGVSGLIAGNVNQFVIQLIGALANRRLGAHHGLRHVLDSQEDRRPARFRRGADGRPGHLRARYDRLRTGPHARPAGD